MSMYAASLAIQHDWQSSTTVWHDCVTNDAWDAEWTLFE